MLPEKNTAQVKTVLIFLTAAKYTKRKEEKKKRMDLHLYWDETRSISIL